MNLIVSGNGEFAMFLFVFKRYLGTLNHIYSVWRNSLGRVKIIVLAEKNWRNYERFTLNYIPLFHFLLCEEKFTQCFRICIVMLLMYFLFSLSLFKISGIVWM